MDAVMLQLTRARNRLTTPATLTLPEIAASGLTVSTLTNPSSLTSPELVCGRDMSAIPLTAADQSLCL